MLSSPEVRSPGPIYSPKPFKAPTDPPTEELEITVVSPLPPVEPAEVPADPPAEQPGISWYEACKVAFDVCFAAVLLVLTSPLMLLAAFLVKLTSRGPVFYSQVRVGKGGRLFRIYKVRSMTHNCEKLSGVKWSTPGDSRVTPVGKFLRRTHLDELPQLWNILRGDMSLVGPRPERPEFIPQLEKAIPCYRDRLRVRPGVTGLAQVQLPPDTDLESVRRKLACDLFYVQRFSFWLDVRLILVTALKVLCVPTALPRKLLQVPGTEQIENAYLNRVAQAVVGPEPQFA